MSDPDALRSIIQGSLGLRNGHLAKPNPILKLKWLPWSRLKINGSAINGALLVARSLE